MDVSRLLNLTGTVVSVTEGEPDEYGDPTETTTERDVRYWATKAGRENAERDSRWQDAELKLFLPPDDPITGADRFRDRDGLTWEVVVAPHNHTHPRTGRAVYVSAGLRRVE